jgi:hypothetical protein
VPQDDVHMFLSDFKEQDPKILNRLAATQCFMRTLQASVWSCSAKKRSAEYLWSCTVQALNNIYELTPGPG